MGLKYWIVTIGSALAVAVMLLIAIFCRGYSISFYGWPHLSIAPNVSSAEKDGYRVTLNSLDWKNKIALEIHVSIEKVATPMQNSRAVPLRPISRLTVQYYDKDGNEIFPVDNMQKEHARYYEEFWAMDFVEDCWHCPYLLELTADVPVPDEASFIAVHAFGVRTRLVDIPLKGR